MQARAIKTFSPFPSAGAAAKQGDTPKWPAVISALHTSWSQCFGEFV